MPYQGTSTAAARNVKENNMIFVQIGGADGTEEDGAGADEFGMGSARSERVKRDRLTLARSVRPEHA